MPKTYTIGGGGAPAPRIDDIVPAAANGPAIQLDQQSVNNGTWFNSVGRHTGQLAAGSSLGTTGLGHCFGLCLLWNKVGLNFTSGYCTHMSSLQGPTYNQRFADIGALVPHNPWVAVSLVNNPVWIGQLTGALTAAGIADDHIWLYVRAGGSPTFGVDCLGNFGER